MKKILTIAACVGIMGITASAKVVPAWIIQDGMVVEHTKPLVLWGTADPGEAFEIRVNNIVKGKTKADANGKWEAKLPALPAGGPYILQIGDKKVTDVLSGDVVLCSGQSNMELYVNRVEDMYGDTISKYSNSKIRQFIAPKEVAFDGPQADLKGGKWVKTTPTSSKYFSALGYFIAMEMYSKTGRPVGIINCSWGGTPIEAWMSEKSLDGYQRQLAQLAIDRDDDYRKHVTDTEREKQGRWNAALWAGDPGREQHWEALATDVSDWKEVDILKDTDWTNDGCNNIAGSHWFVKKVKVPAKLASKPATLRMGVLVDSDSTYVNGEFVGTVSYCYPPRKYKLKEGVLKPGDNTIAVRLVSNGGRGEFIPEKPYKIVFEGGDEISLEGKWKYHQGMRMPSAPGSTFWCYSPTVLYNSMIAPISKYGVGNVVWYQGESNVSNRNEYGDLLKRMIQLWRSDRQDESLPFHVVELANYLPEWNKGGRDAWAEMRNVQKNTCEEVDNCYLVENYDLGEWNDIHPLDKMTLGKRVVAKMPLNIFNLKRR